MNRFRCFGLILALTGAFAVPAHPEVPVAARFSMDRENPRAGEAFLLTLEIRISGDTLDKEISISELPSPQSLQIRSFEELAIETASQGGKPVEIRRFRTWARVMKAGMITVSPRLDTTLIQTRRSHFFMQEIRRPLQIPVTPFHITAIPLPEAGKPPGFSGLVGSFSFTVEAAPLDIAPGDLITLTFTLEGDWLPETYTLPEASRGPGFKVYEVKHAPAESTPTRKVYRQIVVPENNTLGEIPAMTLTYFDTRESRYKTRVAGPFPLTHHAEQAPVYPVYSPTQTPSGAMTSESPVEVATGSPGSGSMWSRMIARLQGHQSQVILGKDETIVRFGPSDSARELFTIKPGTAVMVDSSIDDWVRISCDQGIGWVQKTAVK
jgi:hypothetical protein